MGNVIMSGIVPPLEKPVGGTLLSELAVGSTLKLNVNGVAKDFLVVHQGRPSSMYDDSCDGVWLLMKDVYENGTWHGSKANNYSASRVHTYLNETFLSLLDADIQDIIKDVKIPYRPGSGKATTINSGANGLQTKLFLLSVCEAYANSSNYDYAPADGVCLDYFSGLVATDAKRIAYLDGTATYWWLRSPDVGCCDEEAWYVGKTGGFSWGLVTKSYGVRPAFILPSDLLLQADGTIIV